MSTVMGLHVAVLVAGSLTARPNLMIVLTDDQDYTLGGWRPMQQTKSLIADHGSFAGAASGTRAWNVGAAEDCISVGAL